MNALKISVEEQMLPLDPKVFLSDHMEACKTSPDHVLDFGITSYGKIGKFLQQMAKDGIIEYKEIKKG